MRGELGQVLVDGQHRADTAAVGVGSDLVESPVGPGEVGDDPPDLASHGGRCLADLGQRRQAHRLMDEGIALLPATRAKTQSVFLTDQAETYLRDCEPDIAAETATRSLNLAGGSTPPVRDDGARPRTGLRAVHAHGRS